MRRSLLLSLLAVAALAPRARADELPPTVTWYGDVRLDVIYLDSLMNDLRRPLWVAGEPGPDQRTNQLVAHPMLTRLGARVDPQPWGGAVDLGGAIELDLLGGDHPSPRLRDAYLTVGKGPIEILAGQTWDLASPLRPAADAATFLWDAGNLGGWRTQLRATYTRQTRRGTIHAAVAAGQAGDPVGTPSTTTLRPTAQARLELERERVTAGIWGHAGTLTDRDAYAGGGYVRVNASDRLHLRGEAYYGVNLTDLRGGSSNAIGDTDLHDRGGWAELAVDLHALDTLTVGASADDPRDGDLGSGRSLQYTAYVIDQLRPWDHITVGAELMQWTTHYLNAARGRAYRADVYAIVSF